MWLLSDIQARGNTGNAPGDDTAMQSAARLQRRQRRRTIMRQMLIAAAIAAGLVALWAALLPLAA
jgi:ferric-dicitrate binding protein FerR (iron transport regulator)